MSAQWQHLLKNLGQWQGSFTGFSPQGELIEDTPTVVTLEGQDHNRKIHQVVRYLPPNQPPQEKIFDYSSLSRSILFFENGAFCQGSLHWGPFSEFGAEFGLIEGDRRLRLVQLFNAQGKFARFTLIREKLAGSHTAERPPLTVDQLLGEWQGEAVTIYPDFRPADRCFTHLRLERQDNDHLHQQLTFGTENPLRTITSVARIEGSILYFEQSQLPVQVLLLPDGASCNCPLEIKPRHSFFLEIGWLISPTKRQRLIRSYDQGAWVSLTLVKEEKI